MERAEQTKVEPAELMRVTEGVFALTAGKSMDLTNEKLLLSFQKDEMIRYSSQLAVAQKRRKLGRALT